VGAQLCAACETGGDDDASDAPGYAELPYAPPQLLQELEREAAELEADRCGRRADIGLLSLARRRLQATRCAAIC